MGNSTPQTSRMRQDRPVVKWVERWSDAGPSQKPPRKRTGASLAAGSRSGEVVSEDTVPNPWAASAAVSPGHSLARPPGQSRRPSRHDVDITVAGSSPVGEAARGLNAEPPTYGVDGVLRIVRVD